MPRRARHDGAVAGQGILSIRRIARDDRLVVAHEHLAGNHQFGVAAAVHIGEAAGRHIGVRAQVAVDQPR